MIGTTGYAMIRKPQTGWKKFQSRSNLCTLLGYEGDHIYRMLNSTGKVIRASSVKWNKEKKPANTAPECEPGSKRVCLQESTVRQNMSTPGENENDCTKPCLPDSEPVSSSFQILDQPLETQLRQTRAQTKAKQLLSNDSLGLMACLANVPEDTDIAEPKTYNEAAKCFDWKKWEKGMQEEMSFSL